MKHSVLAVMSFIALTSVACSPALSPPPMVPDLDTATSTTSLTSGEPLPANTAPLEPWAAAPAPVAPVAPVAVAPAAPAPVAPAPVVQTWDAPAPVAAPAQPAVPPLEPWSYP